MNSIIPHGPASSAVPAAEVHAKTRSIILDAAEKLFGRKGVEGTSVRQIVTAAGVNLGAINYHFGTKDRLALEVFARRLEPVNRARIGRLDELERQAGNRPVPVERILDALIRPAVEAQDEGGPNCDDFMRLISRCLQEPNPEVKKFVEEQFEEVARRFDAAILKAVPGLPPGELLWRMSFAFGALHCGQERWLRFDQMPTPSETPAVKPDREGFIQLVIAFITPGLSSPVSALR
ncbi:MAG: TetR/AcrR family transcriptional regulator [Verrucomicrobiota bacterium]